MNTLAQLKQYTTVVADTGDFESMRAFTPQDATTNPTLILRAAQKPEYREIVLRVLTQNNSQNIDATLNATLDATLDALLVAFGINILSIVPGRVSTEVDARLSFDTAATVAKARNIIALYAAAGIDKSRILIKIASTWEGIQAAKQLQNEGVACNMTLLFSQTQALACADVGAQLISPFVGRILDWYKKSTGETYTAETDPGVISVRSIFEYFKAHGIKTEIMGASFRNTDEILALAGCDLLTISPDLLQTLASSSALVTQHLKATNAQVPMPAAMTEAAFRFALNQDAMATEKLAEGIRGFVADTEKLEVFLETLKHGA